MSAHVKKHEEHKCEQCDKSFKYLDLKKKHILISHENVKLYSHFFNNDKTCPFDEIGCMFAHETSEVCRFDKICKNKLCPFQHTITEQEKQNNDKEKGETKVTEEFNITDSDDHEIEMEQCNFKTSPPKKRKDECEDCANQSECIECIVKRYEGKMVV